MDALTYNYLSPSTGTASVSIPSTWTEANVRLALGGTRYFTFNLVKSNYNFSAATTYSLRNGYYSDAGNNAYVAFALTTATNGSATVALTDAVLTGTDVKSTSGLQVCYR